MERKQLNLCILSDAAGGRYETADCLRQPCPLDLEPAQAKHCPCRERVDVGRIGGDGYGRAATSQHTRVLACSFPDMWNGNTIENPQGFAAWLKRQHRGRKRY